MYACVEPSAYQFLEYDECKYYANEKWMHHLSKEVKKRGKLKIFSILFDLSVFMRAFGYNLVRVITCSVPMVIANAV